MATEVPGSALDAAADAKAPRRRRISLLGLLGAVLALALAAVALVQARQFAMLNESVAYQDDYAVLSLYQAESE